MTDAETSTSLPSYTPTRGASYFAVAVLLVNLGMMVLTASSVLAMLLFVVFIPGLMAGYIAYRATGRSQRLGNRAFIIATSVLWLALLVLGLMLGWHEIHDPS